MGEVRDEIQGPAPKRKAKSPGAENILESVRALKDEISGLTSIKDDDAAKEGDAAKAENVRKAGTLRACHSLLSAMQTLLEDY